MDININLGRSKALEDINLGVREDEILAVIGPNGSGKSCLLNCINGFHGRQSGRIFFEIREFFGKALIAGLARLKGRVVGLLANQPMFKAGAAGPQECDKAVDFISLCDSFNIPMVFLHDIPGFLIGAYAEKNRMPTKIMVWLQALTWPTVPKISVVIRKSIGAAYFNMCGPFMGADFLVACPIAEISFTGDEVGVNVVYGRQLAQEENPAEERKRLLERFAHDSAPYNAAAKHFIDDVIDPRDSRKFLCQALDYACEKKGSLSQRLLANWPTGYRSLSGHN